MSSNAPSRLTKQATPAIALLAMSLCFAVFGWGLHYKLSLYHATANVTAHEPAAKLLTDQERAGAQAQVIQHSGPVILPLFIFALLLPSFVQNEWQIIPAGPSVCSRACSMAGPLFRRPPPSAFLLA